MQPLYRTVLLVLSTGAIAGFCQTSAPEVAGEMLARLNNVEWGTAYSPSARTAATCSQRVLAQMDIYATVQWTHHCQDVRGGLISESFFYVFGEPIRTARLRVDLRPEDESPAFTAELIATLRTQLTKKFGTPNHLPEMMEIGFRKLRYGQPVAGDHWQGRSLHYFLHSNPSNQAPAGMRRGAELIVMHDRLMQERAKDDLILRAEGSGLVPLEADPMQGRLTAAVGPVFTKATHVQANPPSDAQQAARDLMKDALDVLRDAFRLPNEEKAMRLLAADVMVARLSDRLVERVGDSEQESALAKTARVNLSAYGIKLGGMTHYGGLAYGRDLLKRVWAEFPETEAGELAFLELQRRGWNTNPGVGCPKNPDLFREVIARGEAFLAERPQTRLRKEILLTLAVANESWWSIAHAPADDGWVAGIPYPRKEQNAKLGEKARQRAIDYYTQIVQLAPESAEAASALRRLPRLELSLDTGQRRFFCSYC